MPVAVEPFARVGSHVQCQFFARCVDAFGINEEANLRHGRLADIADAQADAHQVIDMRLQLCVDFDADTREFLH